MKRVVNFIVAGLLSTLLAGCGSSASNGTQSLKVRLGVFPNVTHAPGLIAIGKHYLDAGLPGAKVDVSSFPSGTAAVEALLGDAVDITYIGSNPAVTAYVQSNGGAVRVVSGATSGGAALVVRAGITTPQDLRGKTLATPSLGNTQDIALRAWLRSKGLRSDTTGGGDVSILPQENAQTLDTFRAGSIDGAWVPEPWATRLVQEGKAHVLVNERDLWPGGRFITTQIVVSTAFLKAHPDAVKAVVAANLQAIDFARQHPTEAQTIVNDQIKSFTGKELKPGVLGAAWKNLTFTPDPIATSLQRSANNAVALKLLKPVNNLAGIYDLGILNALLHSKGRPPVKGLS